MENDDKNKKFKSGLIVLAVIVVAVIGTTIFSAVKSNSSSDFDFTVEKSPKITVVKSNNKTPKPRGDYIAVLYVEGQIQPAGNTYNQAWISTTISTLKEDDKNKAIILYIDSPGGTVYDADETYLLLQDYKTSGKPVYAYMGSMAASGGYYIACAADKIYANRNTLTGSIGVVAGSSIDLTKFFEKYGIKYTTIHAGKNKNMGNYNEPFTEEQQEIMQSIADECYEQFTSIVAKSRDIPLNELLPLCDGRIYTAKQALENGLIDRISSWDEVVETLKLELDNPMIKTATFRYEKQKKLFDTMFEIATRLKGTNANTIEGIPEAMWEKMNVNTPMYIYQ